MEVHEFHTVSVSELVTSVFCIEWSEDNQISLLSEKGVHIFELQPNPLCPSPTAKFRRSFLYATDYLPTEIFSPIVEKVLNNSEKDEMYSLLFEEALTPKFPDKADHIPRIIQVSWSPAGLVEPSKCLLATVTSAGAIDLVFKVGKNWFAVCNLSKIWWDHVKSEMDFNVETTEVDSIDSKTFRKNLRRLQGTATAWSEVLRNTDGYSYLVTAYRSSEIVVWRVNRVSELSIVLNPAITYRRKFDGDVKISRFLWVTLEASTYLILVGFYDGRIFGIRLNEKDGILTENSLIVFENYPDKMPVSFIGCRRRASGERIVVTAKHCFFLTWMITAGGDIVQRQHVQLAGFSITGVLLLDDSKAVVSTQDSRLHCVDLSTSNLTTSLITHDMKSTKIQYLGLTQSPSCGTFVNVASPNSMYDHLVNREPSVLQMFFIKDDRWEPWSKLNSSEENLYKYWDCLEMIRIRAARAADPEESLPKTPEELNPSLSIHKLRVVMWLTLISEVVKKKKVIKKIDNVVGEISEAQPLIFVHTASSHMTKLALKGELSEDDQLSIHFLRLYLEVFLAGEEDESGQNAAIRHAQEAILATSELSLIEAEPCNLCGQIVTELPWNTSSCPQGHQLPRCALTLLQITSLKYRSCPVCGRIFHPSLDQHYEEIRCLYCDVPAVYDSRVVGVCDEVEERCKNLSLRPAWDIQNAKNQEIDAEDKKSKKAKNTAGGFTVVLNKEVENVTETWQEL